MTNFVEFRLNVYMLKVLHAVKRLQDARKELDALTSLPDYVLDHKTRKLKRWKK